MSTITKGLNKIYVREKAAMQWKRMSTDGRQIVIVIVIVISSHNRSKVYLNAGHYASCLLSQTRTLSKWTIVVLDHQRYNKFSFQILKNHIKNFEFDMNAFCRNLLRIPINKHFKLIRQTNKTKEFDLLASINLVEINVLNLNKNNRFVFAI